MAEFDTIPVFNPLPETFSVRFNGELYMMESKETKYLPKGIAFHFAKHLSERCLAPKLIALKAKKDVSSENPPAVQLIIYDNPERRMALFDILGKKDLVEECIKYSNLKGFVGDMSIYDRYVAEKTRVPASPEPQVKTSARQVANPPPQDPPQQDEPPKEVKTDEGNSSTNEAEKPKGGRGRQTTQATQD